MKPPIYPIPDYGISNINAAADNSPLLNDFFVYRSHEMINREKFFHPVRLTNYVFLLILTGKVEIKYNLKKYSLAKNSFTVIIPGTIQEIVKIEDSSQGIFTGFTSEFLGAMITNKKHADSFTFFSSRSDPHFIFTDQEAEALNRHMGLLKEIYNNNEHTFKEEMMHHQFSLLIFDLAAIILHYQPKDKVVLSRKEDLLIGFIKLLNTYIKKERSVQFYADALFVTSKHLTKVVKDTTGKTCGEMIDEMVITEAKILLNDHSYSIGQVADLLNFSDQFFFGKYFKSHVGINPSEYRKLV